MIAQDGMWMTILCISSLYNHKFTNLHTETLTTASSIGEVVLNFTTTTDILPLNEHYLGIIEAQNEMGSRNGSGVYISK